MIQLHQVCFSYGNKKVYDSFTMSLHKGSIYGLLGKNGTGKSTFLKLLAGLIFPDKGTITIGLFNPKNRHPDFLKDIYLIPEEFNLPDVKIDALLKYYAPFYPKFDKMKFDYYIKEFEVPIQHSFSQMSLGQKKKAIISFGLSCNTSLLLMDEPTNGLDIISKAQFKQVMKHTHNPEQCIIVSTHQAKDLESLITRVCIIDEQGMILDKNVEDIIHKLQFKFSQDPEEIERAAYVEEYMNNTKTIILPIDTPILDNKLDLEMLFKAVVTNKQFIQQHLQ
ncbi:MAG: ABC transporter ATP-binding protein [Bacteroidota bacterium]